MSVTPATYTTGAAHAAALDATFGALADPTRRRVIELLRAEPRRASDLADACAATRPAMSRHLKVLRASGLVETAGDRDAADDARERIFQLRPERFTALRDWLDEVERFWTDQLAGFAAHVARTHATTSITSAASTASAASAASAAHVARTHAASTASAASAASAAHVARTHAASAASAARVARTHGASTASATSPAPPKKRRRP